MALERDLELLDDYLSNRLEGNEKEAFEERLKNDHNLSEEHKLQQSLVQGIRQARVAELKSMLNTIPVTSIPPSQTAWVAKVGGWVLVTGLVATAVYFYSGSESESGSPTPVEEQKLDVVQEPAKEVGDEPREIQSSPKEEIRSEPKVAAKEAEPVTRPSIQAYDPTDEQAESVEKYEKEQLDLISNAFVTSSMEVETNNNDKKYNFHYVFKDGKLVLYGAFERHLYEILEFISDEKQTVVLYYKTNYYLLDVSKSTPTALTPIKNRELLKKLQEHRGN